MAIKVGDKAPNFSLPSSEKEMVALNSLEGKNVIVLFFPLAFTGTCTTELCSMRDDISYYSNLDAEILAISVDSPFALEKYKAEQNLNFPLLSDFNKKASTAYGALYDTFAFGMQGVSKRSAFVVDKTGTIQYAEVLDNASELPNFKAIKETLAGL